MPAKKKETQNTEKTSPVKNMTIVELRVIFDRLRKKYNERYDEETFKNERFDVVHKLTYLGDLVSANKGTDRIFTGKELDAIVQYIYEIAEYVFNENKSEIDSYFKYYSSATLDEQNLILRLMDNEWPFYRIKEYINKIRSGEIQRMPAFEELDEADKEELKSHHVALYTPDENRLIVRLKDNGWPDFRIKEFINEIRAGEILGMTASKILEELDEADKEEISLNKVKHDDAADALFYGLQSYYRDSIDQNPFSYYVVEASDGTVYYMHKNTGNIISESTYRSLVKKKEQVYFGESAADDKKDMVNHPPHYNVGGFEVIDIIKTFTEGLEGIEAVDTANAIKYILRWHRKNGVEDLKKAKWYIEHLIKEIEDDSN